jgi:lysyl-tRNA synthetase, class II
MSTTQGTNEERIRSERIAKLEALRADGVDPYPRSFDGRTPVAVVRERFDGLEAGAETGETLRVAGRVMARRGHGKALFADLADRTGTLQIHGSVDATEDYERLREVDLGDVIGVEGEVFCSRRGELSLRVRRHRLLAKCLRPLPEKFHGLTDLELRQRRRYLDLLVNEASRRDALVRSRAVAEMRRYLDEEGFVEVETPVLQPLYGGAAARPFTTHHNYLDRTLYLRIATELYLKRLIVGGLERVYELGKDFRNEGVDATHNPEFTMLEWYEAYVGFERVMERVEQLVSRVAVGVAGSAVLHGPNGEEVDLAPPWRRLRLRDAVLEHGGVDALADRDAGRLKRFLEDRGIDASHDHTWAQCLDHIVSYYVEPALVQPTFLTHYPVELSPLAKRSPDDPDTVERLEAFCLGMELGNGYTELNDPADQRERFEEAQRAAAAGDAEAHPMDEDYLLALEYGLPPTGGMGIGVDRIAMLLTGRRTIREVVLFPALRS